MTRSSGRVCPLFLPAISTFPRSHFRRQEKGSAVCVHSHLTRAPNEQVSRVSSDYGGMTLVFAYQLLLPNSKSSLRRLAVFERLFVRR